MADRPVAQRGELLGAPHDGVEGARRLGSFDGTISIPDDALDATVEASIDVASIDTHDDTRDEHLRGTDFFDVANSPTITFRSTRLEQVGGDYRLHGDLTIKGTTRPISLDLDVGGVARTHGATPVSA